MRTRERPRGRWKAPPPCRAPASREGAKVPDLAAERPPIAKRAFAEFLKKRPEYERRSALDTLRQCEFARLDAQGQVYLDYTGSGLYGASQVERHAANLLRKVLGNPHSANPASLESTALVEHTRSRVLSFFRADPSEYAVVFTANACHALKLVGESGRAGREE